MITPSDLTGVDESLARRIIAVGRSIAPCLDSLVDEAQLDAIAILSGVAAAAKVRIGADRVGLKSQSIGPARVEYDVSDWFTTGDEAGLRSLCDAASPASGPLGSFPRSSRAVDRMWPEWYD